MTHCIGERYQLQYELHELKLMEIFLIFALGFIYLIEHQHFSVPLEPQKTLKGEGNSPKSSKLETIQEVTEPFE